MKKFIFSGTTKANYTLLAETGSAFLFLWSEKNRAAETLQFSAAITCQLWQVGVKETDRLSVRFEGMCCALREALIISPNEMRCKADGAQETIHTNRIGEFLSTTQRRTSLVQAINQHFLSFFEFCRTECGMFPEKRLQTLKYDYFSTIS